MFKSSVAFATANTSSFAEASEDESEDLAGGSGCWGDAGAVTGLVRWVLLHAAVANRIVVAATRTVRMRAVLSPCAHQRYQRVLQPSQIGAVDMCRCACTECPVFMIGAV